MIYYHTSHNNKDGIERPIMTLYRFNNGTLEYYNRTVNKWKTSVITPQTLLPFKNCNKNLYTFQFSSDKIVFDNKIAPFLCKLIDEIY